MRFMIPLAAALAAWASPLDALAQSEFIKARPRLWYVDLDGTMLGDGGAVTGTELDLPTDMGIEDDRGRWLEVMFSQGQGRTWFSIWESKANGDPVTLASEERLNGVVFPDTTVVTGEIDLKYYRLLRENILDAKNLLGMAVIFTFITGFEYMDIAWSLTDGSSTGEEKLTYYRPEMGFRAEAYASRRFRLELYILGFPKWEFDDVRARTLEAAFTVSFAFDRFGIEVGYRKSNFFAEEDKSGQRAEFDIDADGWFAGLSISF